MEGKYQRYSEYKDSGIDWCEMFPSHWAVSSMRWLSNLFAGGTPDKNNLSYWENGTIPWLNSGAVNQVKVTTPSAYITQEAYQNSSAKWIPSSSLVMALAGQGKTKGMTAMLEIETTCNQSMAAIVPDKKVIPSFLFWWLTANYQNIRNMSGGDNRDGLNLELLGNIKCPVLSKEEQRAIANFLDHETVKIDALIEKQEKLIELLKEKRQAVISHAVTKGLNPDVPMKDSGIEWLGEVPEHWKVSRLKFETEVVDCRNKTPVYFDDGEYFVVRTSNVKNQQLNLNGALYTDETNFKIWTQRGVPPAGSILFTREAPTGEVCIVPEQLKFCMGQRMMNFIPNCSEYRDYLFDFLISDCLDRYINAVSYGSTVSHLRVEQVENIPVLVPPIEEIKQIHSLIAGLKKKFDSIEKNALDSIFLLKERKSSLISAAVTGKIDVRNWYPASKEEAHA